MTAQRLGRGLYGLIERLGYVTVQAVESIGYLLSLAAESLYWVFWGARRKQAVRLQAVVAEMVRVGVGALPIVTLLALALGIMLAIQIIPTLREFRAESQVISAVSLSVTREFAPLIIAIFVAGRSGSAFAASVATMQQAQEIDALRVIGISPVRYLVAPAMLAMLFMLPVLTIYADLLGVIGGALYSLYELDMALELFFAGALMVLSPGDLIQGLVKSVVFAMLIVLIAYSNGFSSGQGALGVGKASTRAVVASISAIILADMVLSYLFTT